MEMDERCTFGLQEKDHGAITFDTTKKKGEMKEMSKAGKKFTAEPVTPLPLNRELFDYLKGTSQVKRMQ